MVSGGDVEGSEGGCIYFSLLHNTAGFALDGVLLKYMNGSFAIDNKQRCNHCRADLNPGLLAGSRLVAYRLIKIRMLSEPFD